MLYVPADLIDWMKSVKLDNVYLLRIERKNIFLKEI